jgi:haloalkane dehalogenase
MQATPTPLPGPGPGRYRFVDHRDDLDGLLTALGVIADIVIVGHDRSGVLGIDWARRHPDAVRGIAYRETLVSPVSRHGENAPDPELFRPLRSDADERLVLRDNVFVETVLPAALNALAANKIDRWAWPPTIDGQRVRIVARR